LHATITFAECAPLAQAWNIRGPARPKREERAGEHPYRASQSVEPARAKRVESEQERASAEPMDQWVIVAIALQWAMPVAPWMLAARYVLGC
jgi:hypothetical protein